MSDDYWGDIFSQYYSGFSPQAASQASQAMANPQPQPTYQPTQSAPQQLIGTAAGASGSSAQQAGYTPQTLISSPYAQTPGGYSPGGYGASGPPVTNFIQSDGLAARGVSTGGGSSTPAPDYSNPQGLGGNYNDQFNAPYSPPAQTFDQFLTSQGYSNSGGNWGRDNGDSFGALDGGALSGLQYQYNQAQSGGATLGSPSGGASLAGYQPQPTYASPAGGAALDPSIATGGASLAGYQPQPTYASPAGGASLGNTAATGGADLSANNSFDLANFQNIAPTSVPTPPPRPSSLDTGGAGLQAASPPIDTSFQNPSQSYQNPTTSNTFGDLNQVSNGMSNADLGRFDQSYMDSSQGPFGSLIGGNDANSPSTYTNASGQSLGQPSQPISTAYQNPPQPVFTPTQTYADGGASFATPPNMPSSQMFAQAGPTFESWMGQQGLYQSGGDWMRNIGDGSATVNGSELAGLQSTFGSLNPVFQPMSDPNGSKIADRAPQMGGFVSYSAPQLGPVSSPSQPPATGIQAISNALFH